MAVGVKSRSVKFLARRLGLFLLVSGCGGCSALGTLLAVIGQNIRQSATRRPEGFKIVSGGQTGADRAGLDWAVKHGIPHGGWCPEGRRAEDAPIDGKYLPSRGRRGPA
jgi:hypothetical protein